MWAYAEAERVQEGPAILLRLLQQLISMVLHALCVRNLLAELKMRKPLGVASVVVLDVHLDHTHGLAGLLLSGVQIFHHLACWYTLSSGVTIGLNSPYGSGTFPA